MLHNPGEGLSTRVKVLERIAGMKLTTIVSRDAIIPRLGTSERDQTLNDLIDALLASGAADPKLRPELVSRVLERERRGSTGFGKGIAVPHVKHKNIKRMAAAIGLSATGVDFSALDHQPVYSVFLLLSPEDRPDDHLMAMEVIFKHLSQETFRRFLRQAQSTDDVWTLLEEADGNLG
ncbi:MAG: PTS sugar transporter subunit IIA [Phycisphaerales bacterium]|nr:PTS sugar transporter subunit IIA [Phycisphaerales bacterium]